MTSGGDRLKNRLALLANRPFREQAGVIAGAGRRALKSVRDGTADSPDAGAHLHPPDERLVRRPDLRVAGILDAFSHVAFQYEFHLRALRADGWREEVDSFEPHMLFVESAWLGRSSSWQSKIARLDEPHPVLVELVRWFRSRHLPTVFWNKEDPPNYPWFIESAKLFDHVFTVDEGSLTQYRDDLGHARIGVLPFAAQPRVHTPVMAEPERRGELSVAFAGTYFRRKYPDRRNQMETVLDPARAFGLSIYSRVGSDPANRWPRKYRSHVVGSLDYLDMLEAYKRHRVFLNVGSVPHSSTMCPRRVFELMASGTTVLSYDLPSLKMVDQEGLVRRTLHPEHTRQLLTELLSGRGINRASRAGALRQVHSGHTYSDRVDTMLSSVLGRLPAHHLRTAVLIHLPEATPTAECQERVLRWIRDPQVAEVHLGGPGATSHDLEDGPRVRRHTAVEDEPRWIRRVLAELTADLVLRASAGQSYARTFLQDATAAFTYSDAEIVGPPPPTTGPDALDRHLYRYGPIDASLAVWRTGRLKAEAVTSRGEHIAPISYREATGPYGLVVPLDG